jgi:tetratricopeptide (TPR) repeat protein
LYGQEYQAYNFNVDRAASPTTPQPITRLYQNADYASAVAAYKSITDANVNDQMAAAFSYMQLKQYQPATQIFEQVIRNNALKGSRIYQDEAEYYLALSLLQLHQVDKSLQLFDKIYTDAEHTYNGRVDSWFMTRLRWLK